MQAERILSFGSSWLVALLLFASGCGGNDDNQGDPCDDELGDVVVDITVQDLSTDLDYNQAHVAESVVDYAWEASINIDGEASTGDLQGFDTTMSLQHFKPAGSPPASGSPDAFADAFTFVLRGNRGVSSEELMLEILHDVTDTTWTIRLLGSSCWDELLGLGAQSLTRFHTTYASDPLATHDQTDELVGMGSVSDPADDVDFDFVDIVSAKLVFP